MVLRGDGGEGLVMAAVGEVGIGLFGGSDGVGVFAVEDTWTTITFVHESL